jgi:hypothetical protein
MTDAPADTLSLFSQAVVRDDGSITNPVLYAPLTLLYGVGGPSVLTFTQGGANAVGGPTNRGLIDFAPGLAGRQADAGKMGYEQFGAGEFDIVGAGTAAPSRRVQIWDILSANAQIYANYNQAAQIQLATDGHLYWGNPIDVSIYRTAAYELTINNTLRILQNLVVGQSNSSFYIYWGSALDTNLYRTGAGGLKTDGVLNVGQNLFVSNRIFCGAAGTGGIWVDGYSGSGTQFIGSFDATHIGIYLNAWRVLFDGNSNMRLQGGACNINLTSDTAGYVIGAADDAKLYRTTQTGVSGPALITDQDFWANRDTGVVAWCGQWIFVNGVGGRRIQVGGVNSGGTNYRQLIVLN